MVTRSFHRIAALLAPLCACTSSTPSRPAVPALPSEALPWVGAAADGSVAGTVRDVEGAPVAGAQVCAFHPSARQLPGETRRPVCVASEADGTFVIAGLTAAAHDVHASAEGFHPRAIDAPIVVHAGQRVDGLRFALVRGGAALRVKVQDLHGGPIAGAWVTNWIGDREDRDHGAWTAGRSDAAGQVTLWVSPGIQHIEASAPGHAPTRVEADTSLAPTEVVLTPESTIAGAVLDEASRARVAGARVEVREVQPVPVSAVAGIGYTDASGAFRVGGLRPGRYDVRVQIGNRDGAADRAVVLGFDQHVTLPAVALASLPSLRARVPACTSGWVVAPDGRREAIGADGEVFWPALEPGSHRFEVQCDGRYVVDHEVTIVATPLAGLVWEPGPAATQSWGSPDPAGPELRGVVVDVRGVPVRGALVRDLRAATASAMSDAAGRFVLRGAPPGTMLSVFPPGVWYDHDSELVSPPVAVDPTREARLTVAGEVTPIRGRVLAGGAPRAGARVVASSVSEERAPSWTYHDEWAVTDSDGRFTLAGTYGTMTYALRAYAAGGGEGSLASVRAGAEVTIEVPPAATIAGSVTGTRRFAVGLVDAAGHRVAERRLDRTDGRFGFEDVAPGTYTLHLVSREGCASQAVTVAPGERREDMSLTTGPTGGLRGRVVDRASGVGDANVVVWPRDPTIAALHDLLGETAAPTGSDGGFVLTDLCPGPVDVQARGWGADRSAAATIEPAAFTELQLRLDP